MKKTYFIVALALLVLATFLLATFTLIEITNQTIKEPLEISPETISLEFYDAKTSCPLQGEVYINEKRLGSTLNGQITFEKNQLAPGILSIKGKTNNCFEDQNFAYLKKWSLNKTQNLSSTIILETQINPRTPETFYEIQSFIRPQDVQNQIVNVADLDTEEAIDKLADLNIRYRQDWILFGESYWQTPLETLELGHGDCEDWAVTAASLIRAYDPSQKCYTIIWQNHMNIFCHINGKYILYDQDGTKIQKKLNANSENEQKIELRSFINNYFDSYNIPVKMRKVQGIANEKEYIKFENNEEFIDWLLELQ